ncbi:MAG: family 10 glycosylhydrolase [Armatimonadota bacterium]
MRHRRRLGGGLATVALTACLLAVWPAQAQQEAVGQEEPEMKKAIMCVDFFDLCYYADWAEDRLYTPEDIRSLFEECKAAGISEVLWRLSACGSAVYQSEVEDRNFRDDPRAPAHAVADFIDQWDPLHQACTLGHQIGLPVYAWITVYDEGLPEMGHMSALLREHPEYQWVDRTGELYLTGVPCYAFPEARRFRVRMVEEICRYPVDGVFISLRSHAHANDAYSRIPDGEQFGYEEPIVEEYRRRHGVDIRTEEFDEEAWHALKGEYFTQLLREIREVVGPWRELQVIALDWYEGPTSKSRHDLDYEAWAEEGLVDAVYATANFKVPPADFDDKYAFIRDLGMDLYCFRGIPDEDATWENIPTLMEAVEGTAFQGLALMEAYKFQILRGQTREELGETRE